MRDRRQYWLALGLLALGLAAFPGCDGSGSGESTPTGATVTPSTQDGADPATPKKKAR